MSSSTSAEKASPTLVMYLLGDFQTLAALGATRNDAVPPIAIAHEDAAGGIAFAA
jgi:hypothetical protein